MNRTITILSAVIIAAVAAIGVQAVELGPVTTQERATWGATHFIRITHEDLTTTATNTAQAITNFSVSANSAVEFKAMVLETPFETGNTNFTGSTLLTVGDGSDADLYLASTELNLDGTEVYVAFPPVGTVNVGATGEVTSVTALGRKLYTAADTVDATFTPNSDEAVGSLTNGAVRLYLNLINPFER